MTLNEKYVEDYNSRFARKAIVSDGCLARLSWPDRLNSCSYKEINDWTHRWMFENGGTQTTVDREHSIKGKLTFDLKGVSK